MNTLEMIDRDPGIEAAADDLSTTVTAFIAGQARPGDGSQRRDTRVLREAFPRLREACQRAAERKGMGLE